MRTAMSYPWRGWSSSWARTSSSAVPFFSVCSSAEAAIYRSQLYMTPPQCVNTRGRAPLFPVDPLLCAARAGGFHGQRTALDGPDLGGLGHLAVHLLPGDDREPGAVPLRGRERVGRQSAGADQHVPAVTAVELVGHGARGVAHRALDRQRIGRLLHRRRAVPQGASTAAAGRRGGCFERPRTREVRLLGQRDRGHGEDRRGNRSHACELHWLLLETRLHSAA